MSLFEQGMIGSSLLAVNSNHNTKILNMFSTRFHSLLYLDHVCGYHQYAPRLSFPRLNLRLCKPPLTRSVHYLTRKLAPRPDPRAVENQYPRHNGQQRANAAEQTARRAVAKAVVHLCCYEWEYAA